VVALEVWTAHADYEEFDEACELTAGLYFKELSRSEAGRKGIRSDPRWNFPYVERDFLDARVRNIADSFGSNSDLERSACQQ
jgi:hypothetical protein